MESRRGASFQLHRRGVFEVVSNIRFRQDVATEREVAVVKFNGQASNTALGEADIAGDFCRSVDLTALRSEFRNHKKGAVLSCRARPFVQ